MNDYNQCNICSSTNLQAAHLPSPYYILVRCDQCNHCQIAKESTQIENEKIQLKYFDQNFANRKGGFISYYEGINCRRTVKLLGLISPTKILEVGPGSGSVMYQFSKLGHNVTGLDLSQAVAKNIEAHYGLTVVTNTLREHMEVECGKYGSVIMRHVLEHFSDPLGNMKAVYKLLQQGGILYLAVPNTDSWHNKWRGWAGYEPYHVQYFSRKSVVKCLELAGFKIVQVGSYEPQSGWVNTIIKSIRTPRDSSEVSNKELGGGRYRILLESTRFLIGLIISPLRWFQSTINRGEELFVIAQRPHN